MKNRIRQRINEDEAVLPEERARNNARLNDFLNRIRALVAEVEGKCVEGLGKLADQKTAADRAAWLEQFGDEAFEHPQLSNLALDIMDEISDRFSRIEDGELERSSTGWPILWTMEANDRAHFLSAVRWFSSNHYKQFGRLLTPFVNGIRVKGPLFPELDEVGEEPRLVLLDGQGFGHTAKSVSSVSTRIARKFTSVDMILLVDNAQQPMQAAPLSLLRSVCSSGFTRKLAIAFTHFDQVKGANLGSFKQKREHVFGSVGNAIASLQEIVGPGVVGVMERQVDSHSIFLGGLDRRTAQLPGGFKRELTRLIAMMQRAAEPAERTDCGPVYEFEGLESAIQKAIEAFKDPWEARLGVLYDDNIREEHWTRIKALSRRLAERWADEYDTLTPVADLLARLQEGVSMWLEEPAGWNRQPENDDERESALDAIREAAFKELYHLTRSRLANDQLANWREAYEFSGPGSASERSCMIRKIHDHAAPPIGAEMNADAQAFMRQLHDIMRDAIHEADGHVLARSAKQTR